MRDLNHTVLIGRLTRDIEVTEIGVNKTPKGVISIAVNDTHKQGDKYVEEVSYFNVTLWGKQAETLKPFLVRGKQISVEGKLKQDRWEKDGQKHSMVSVIATSIQLLGGKGGSDSDSQSGYDPQPAPDGSDFPEDVPF